MFQNADQLEGERIEAEGVFSFRCGPDLACFNTCCSNKRLSLLPYDMLRLRRGLGKSSAEILGELVTLEMDPVTGWPALRLALDQEGRCPLVGPEGCRVYAHRPTACRIFPLARAVKSGPQGGPVEQIFLKPPPDSKCLGWGEPRSLSLAQWIEEQGLAEYFDAHDRLLRLLSHPDRKGRLQLNQRQTHAVIMSLYNLDVFRQMAGQEGFAQKAGLPAELAARAQSEDEALLELGEAWLTAMLFPPSRA